ncbi:MAG: hypothetical protein ACPGGK_18425 [Pikeienuella sp.]
MTYPEWHIVHAYADYAQTIQTGDPHDYQYLRAIEGFWTSLCSLTETASAHGEVDGATKQMVYVIGVSFTAELLLKAAYEETLGRLFASLRGAERSPLDNLSAEQASSYAAFLQQTPWYKWQFRQNKAALNDQATTALRDRERRVALGIEYGVKAAYANVIVDAVAQMGQDDLTLRMIVKGADPAQLESENDVTVLAIHPEGIEVETTRYRALTHRLERWAHKGMNFIEIAGNDDILFTVLSETPEMTNATYSRSRQGAGGFRHLVVVKVHELADFLRTMETDGYRLEHIHDY